jgi:hypothetical protein
MLDDTKQSQPVSRTLGPIREEGLPQQKAEVILHRTSGLLQAWQSTKHRG